MYWVYSHVLGVLIDVLGVLIDVLGVLIDYPNELCILNLWCLFITLDAATVRCFGATLSRAARRSV